MQSSQVRNVGLPSSADTKRDVPAWTQDPKIFPLDWFSVSRPNIIRQTKEYVSELSKWRNCPKIKTLSKLKAVLKRIMMFLHTHITYIDGKSLLECDLEEDLITLVSLYMDMELRVLLIKKSATSGASSTTLAGPVADADTARNDKLVSDRIAYWLYTVLTGHDQRVDALLSTTVFTRHTRPVLDPIFRKVLSEMSDGPFTNVNYVRHMLAYKTWRERTLVLDDTASLELNSRVLQQLVPRDYAFPPPLLRCLGKGDNAREHARPHNINLADACRNFMRYCREIPAAAAEQINFESIPLFDDDLLGDEEGEVNKIMNMISSRKQRKTASLSPRRNSQVDAFIDLTVPKSRTGAICGNPTSLSDVIDLTEEDEKPIITSRTAAVVEHSAPTPLRTPAVQRISTSKKQQPSQDCSYSMAPSTPQVETRCFTAYRDQDIYLVNISCMCPVRAHRQRECQCQDKKIGYHKENKALKALTERKCENDATFVGRCFQFSIGNQYAYPSEDDVDTEMQPLVVGNSQDQVKLEMRASNAVTCNKDESRDEATDFCDKLFSASLNHCDCDGCKRRDSLSRYENRTCSSAASNDSKTEISDNVQCRQKSLVTYSHTPSVADMYAMDKANPIVLHSQTSAQLPEDRNQVEYFPETLDKRKLPSNESNDYFTPREDTLNNNFRNEIRKIKLPIVQTVTDKRPDNVILSNEDIFPVESEPIVLGTIEEISKSTNITDKISTITENSESQKLPPEDFSKETTDLDETNTQNKTSPLVSDSRTEIEQLCSEITDLSYSEHLEKETEVTETTCNVLEKDCVPDETVNSNFEEREDIHCTDTLIEDQKIDEVTDILPPRETNDLKTVNTTLSNIEEREDINCTVAPIEDQKIEEETVLLPQHTNDLEVLEELEQTNEQEIVSTDLLENRKRQIVVGKEITITEETDTHLTSKVSEEFEACTQENRNEQENCETQILFNKDITITEENNTHLTSNDFKEFENCSSQEIRNTQENMGTEILENCETQTPVDKEVTITEGTDALLEQNYLSNEIGEISSQTEIESNILSENILTNENKVIEEPISNISVIIEEKIDDTPTEKTIIEETVYCFSEMITELNEEENISECLNLPDFTRSVAIEANVSSEDISTNEIIITEKPISVIEETKPVEKTNTEEYVCENKNIHYSFHDNASSTKLQDIEETAPVVEIIVESEISIAGTHEIETTNQINSKDHIINDHSEDNNEDASLETEIVHEIHEIETENHPVAAIHEIETTNQKTSSDFIITDQLSTEKKDYVQETEICAEIVHEIEGATQSVADIHEIETTNQQSSSDCNTTDQSSTNKDFLQDTEICAEFAHDTEATTQPVAAIHEIETTKQHSITIDLSTTNKEDCVQDTEICTDIGHDIEATPQSVVDIHEIKTTNQQSSSDCNTTDQSSINKEDFVQDTEICTEIHHAIEATSQPVAAIHEKEKTNQQFNSDYITIDQSTTNNDDFVQEYEICTEIDHEIEATPQSFADSHEVETTNRQSSSDCITTDQSSTNKEYFVQETEICHEIEATNEHVAAIHEIETTNLQSNSDSINIDESIINKEHFVQETEICAEIVHEIEATSQSVAATHEIEATKQQCDLDSISTDQLSTNNEDFVKETEICTEFAQEIEATTQPVAATHEIEATNEQSNLDSISTDQLSTNNEDFIKETEICTEFAQEIEAASLPVDAIHEIKTTNQQSNLDYISADQLSTNNEDFAKETKICTELAHEIEATSQPVAAVHEIEITNLQYNSDSISTGQLSTSNEDFVKETEICAEFAQEIEATSQPVAAVHEIDITNLQYNSDSISTGQLSTSNEDFVKETEICAEFAHEIEATTQPVAVKHEIETNNQQSNSDSINIELSSTNKEYFVQETEISVEIVHEIEATCQPVAAIHEIETTNQQSNSDSITTDQLSTNNEVFVKETEFAHEIKATSQPIVAIHEIETTNQQSYSDSVTIDQSSTNKEHFVHETEICAEIVHEIEATNQQSNLDSISSDQLSTNNEDFVKETEICSEFIHEIEGTSLPIPAIREIESTNLESSTNKEDFVEETEIIHEIEITQQSKSSDTNVTEICIDVSHEVEAINLSASSDIVDNSSTNFEDFIPGTIITADTAQVIETINQQPNPDSIVDTNFEEIIPKIEIVHVPMSKRKRRTSIRDHVEEEVQFDVPKMSPTKRRRCKTSIEATNEEKEKIDVPLHEETSFKINNLTEISNSEIAEENTEVLYTQLETTSVEKSAKKTIPFKESNLVYNSEETQQKIAPKERASKKRRKTNLNVRKDKKSMKETSKSEKIDSTEDKKLIIRCERLSLKDIEHLSKLNRTTCDNDTKIPAKENINKMRLTSRRKNQVTTPTNNLKEDTITQEATVKNEQNKINSNSEKNNINKNVDIPSFSEFVSKEKEKQGKIKGRPRKKKQIDNNENTNKPSENQINTISNLADVNTEIKIKRPRGRPPKNSFFSENLNLQNVNSKNTNVLVNGNDTHCQTIPDEDVPLLVRKCLSPKRNSLKISQKNSISDLENNINNEDDLPLLSRKQKLKPNKIVKTYSAKTKLKKALRKEGSDRLIKQTELRNEIKSKSFRDKLNQFKYKPRSKTDQEDIAISPKKILNSEKNSKRNIRTYGNTKSLKRTELQTTEYEEFPIPDIMKAEPKHENSTKSETSPKNNKNSEMLLHRAERVKIKKFREIPDETNLQTGKDNKNDSDSSNEIIDSNSDYSATNKRKANSEEHVSNDNQPKFLNNFSCEVKITEKVSELNNDQPSTVGTPLKNNCPLNPKKLFSKRARERLELQTKAASENNINATNNIEQELNSKDVSDEKIIVNNPCKEVVNNNLQQFSISSPVEEKIGEIENKSIQELVCPNNKEEHLPRVAEEIVKSVGSSEKLTKFHKNEIMSNETTENIRSPVKKTGKSKFPKLKIKLDSKSNFLPKNLRKNVKTSPTLKNRKKKKFKSKLNGTSNKNANVKQSEESVEQSDFSNKSELKCDKNIDQNDLDINKNNEIETIGTGEYTSKPEVDKIDEIEYNQTRKEIVKENIDKNLTQSSEEILSNINNKNKKTNKENINVNSTQSSKEVPSNNEDLPNITIDQDEKKTKLESPQIDKKSAEMVYKPCNKIYEKNFDFYSDHDDGSNSELVIDTSAESSEAEDTVTENKTQEKKNLVQNDIPVSKPKYHHLIEEIVNLNENTNKNIPTNFEHVISHVTEIENPVVEETVVETLNYSDISDEPEKSVQDISKNMFEESFQKTEECIVDHVETTDVSISVVEETVVENMIVEESVVENIAVEENIVEDICVKQQNLGEKKKDFVEQTAEIIEIPPDEFFEEIHSEDLIEEKLQLDLEPYGPSVEMIVKVDIGLESCTIFQKTLLVGEHVKETCVKCSVNGKHKNNRRVLVYGLPLYNEQNILKQCLDDCPRIPAIPYRQAVENIEKSPCTLTANVESVKICKDNNIPVSAVKNIEKSPCTLTANVESVKICKNNNIPVLAEEIIEKSPCILTALDNSKLVFLANVATNTAHLTTKTDNHNPYPDRPSDNDHNPNSMDIHDKCMIVAFPDDLKPSNKPTTTISVIKDKHTTIPVEIQTLAERIPPKGIVLENKIQEITLERVKNGNRINGENLDELYKSLENICELEINTLTKIPDSHSHLPATILTTIHDNSKISEPIPIDIPNTALLHLTPDDDDFMIHNEPFCLHPKQIQISPVKSSTEAVIVQDKPNLDASGFVNNLFNLANSVTESQKTDNKSTDQKSVNEKQPEVKTKSKRGRKPKSSTNRNSETNYLFNVYKSNQDSNKSVDTNNQQIVNNNKSTPSPQRYIRTTRPMKMVSTKKRNVNVLENTQQEEPPKKVSASEKMFDLLLEEHRKEQSVAKLKTPEKNMEEIISTNNTTLPDLDDKIPETTVISTTLYNDEQHIPLPVLNFEVTETESQKIVTEDINKSEEVLKQKIDNQVDIQTEITEVQTNEEITEHPTNTDITEIKTGNEITEIQTEEDIEVQNNIEITEVQTKKEITEIKTNNKITEIQTEKEITEIQTEKEITEVQTKKEITEIKTNNKITEIQTEKETTEIQTEKEITEIQSIEENTEMLTDKEKQVEGDSAIGEEDPDSSDRNVSAIEVVQDWFNRVHDNKSHTEPYNEITSYQTIEECNFFEEMSNASENSPNSRKTDDKVFSEHQTPDSGIAFDEDSVQKDKSVPENLSDADGEAAATNFDDLDEYISESEKIVISDSQSSYGNQLKVSISLERIQEILPHLKKYKFTSSTEIKIRKRKDHDTEYEKAKKMKYSTEVEQNIIIEEYTSDNDVRIKRRQSCNDDVVPEFSNEEVKSPSPSQKDLSAPIRTKGSVKEYPDCLFGITESPVPSGSFHSPYPSDISLTEEPTFYEEGGIDLCNDYPCYDSFEVLQEQQSLQKEYNVVDDNPKDVQQGLQAGYCVVDSQFLPLSEYMNDGDYILIDNKIFNDKKMVPVNMHLVQPETKPHNSEEVKKSEFDDSEKEDSLSDTVEEIIKNPNLFPEQSNSEVQVINMDQATSEVQVVIACGTYQETEMSDTYLFGIAVQSEVNNSDISVPEATLPQHSPMTIEEIPPESKVTDNSDFKPTTPIVGSESTQICNTDILPATDVPQPESVDLLATVAPVPDPIVTDDSLTKKKKLSVHTAESKQIDDIKLKCKPNSAVETQKLNSDKVITRRTSVTEIHVSNAASRTPAYSPPSQVLSKSQNPASNSIQSSSSYNSKKNPKPNCTKSPKMSYELNTTSTTKVVYNLKISEKSPSTSSKVQKLNDLHPRNKVSVLPSSYSAQRLQNAGQKQLAKKLTDLKMQQKPQMTRQAEKTYSSKASEDAFDRLKHDKTDIPPPPDSRRFYSQSNSDPNYLKNRRKDVPSGDYYRRYSIERDSSKSRHPSQSDIRRPHSSHAESNPKQTYRLPASDPSYRSSHNNSRRPEVKKPDQKPPPSGATSSQKDWLKNETLLNLIKASNTIFSKKY